MTGIPQRDWSGAVASPAPVRRFGTGGAGGDFAGRVPCGPARSAGLPGPRGTTEPAGGVPSRLSVLLVEDDDGDALLVEELFLTATGAFQLRRARSLAEAKPLLNNVSCVLLDLGLADATGLEGLHWLRAHVPQLAVVVLTGQADERRGEEAVSAGAQDYLVKGQVDGQLLGRVVRYAVERLRAVETQTQLRQAQLHAEERSRLERGLLPSPLVSDPRLTVIPRYRPGQQRMLLGGDFYDVVQTPDGWVHAVIGDVCGHGPDEAALGVCLRVAWRTLVLAGRPVADFPAALRQVFEHERHPGAAFTTLCMVSLAPDRDRALIRLVGHPAPLLLADGQVTPIVAPVSLPLGLEIRSEWPPGEIRLGGDWAILMYTDALEESRVTPDTTQRLGDTGLATLFESFLHRAPHGDGRYPWLVDSVIEHVSAHNGGGFDDDMALLALIRTA